VGIAYPTRWLQDGDRAGTPLVADNEFQGNLLSVEQLTIWQNNISIPSTTEFYNVRPFAASTSQINIANTSIATNKNSIQVSVSESASGQISHAEINSSKRSSVEVAISYDSFLRTIGSIHFGSTQVGVYKSAIPETSSPQISTSQIHSNQSNSTQIAPTQFGFTQIGSAQVSPAQVSPTQVGSTQISPTQIDLKQIGTSQLNSREVSLTYGITLQQFLSSHHYNLSNTTVPAWTSFLQGQTPFNLTIDIKDLPTGQLAEASLTSFDSSGRPTSGTLTLDLDGNGLGWFIDSTPWDNSEFKTQNSEFNFRATPGSEAFGRYDLLTTILHEMGHLAGFINGYEGFDTHVQTINGVPTFVGNGFTATLTGDRSHLNPRLHPHDLMNTTLAPGVRKRSHSRTRRMC
jgi:hypothetical protein